MRLKRGGSDDPITQWSHRFESRFMAPESFLFSNGWMNIHSALALLNVI